MDIQDILRGLPFPVQGALMSLFGAQGQSGNGASNGQSTGAVDPRRQSLNGLEAFDGSYDAMGNYTGMGSGILSQPATATATPAAPAPAPVRPRQFPKDEAGFESLITRVMANDSGAAPQVPTLPVTEVPNLPPVAAAMAQQYEGPSAASLAPDNRDVGGGQNFAMQGPAATATPERGFFDKLLKNEDAAGNSAFMHIMRGLGAAGSADPMKAMAQFAAQDTENMKLSEARRRANMPKVDHIAGTPYFQITKPDGTTQMTSNPALAKFYEDESKRKLLEKKNSIDYQADATEDARRRGVIFEKATTEAGGATTKAEFSPAVSTQLKQVDELLKQVPGLEKLPFDISSPVVSNVWDQTVGRVFGTNDYEVRRNVDTVFKGATLEVVKSLGSNPSEGDRKFAELMQASQDDPLGRKLMMLQEYRSRIKSREDSRVEAAQRRDSLTNESAGRQATATPTAAAAPTAPAASRGVARPANKAQYDALEKGDKYIAPNGMELTKK